MDFLKAEIERQEGDRVKLGGQTKYMRRGDLEKQREKRYWQEVEEEEKQRAAKRAKVVKYYAPTLPPVQIQEEEPVTKLSDGDLKTRFRARGQPICLFGESHEDKIERLKRVESVEERSNPVTMKALFDAAEKGIQEDLLKGDVADVIDAVVDVPSIDTRGICIDLVKNDLDTACLLMEAFFKNILKIWSINLQQRPDEVKRTSQGKLQTVTLAQSTEHLTPFWKGLRDKTFPKDVMCRMADVCHHMEQRNYNSANDSYIRLSIGNAPWPIGITGTGMHERKGDDKLKTSEIAHVLNDETQRKWIQSIKRLMTVAELEWPTSAI